MDESELFVVATPIGNLEDMSFRALRILKESDVIACEDTNRARKLLTHFGVGQKELISYYDPVEKVKSEKLIARLLDKPTKLSLISDAGTPCISDPGYRLISKAHANGIKVIPIPGPSSVVSIVSASGLSCDRFCFIGFLPNKSSACKREVDSWTPSMRSIVFFDSLKRLSNTIDLLGESWPGARLAIGRELTKLHEQIFVGSLEEAKVWLSTLAVAKGEVTVMVELPNTGGAGLDDQMMAEIKAKLAAGATFKDLLKEYGKCGLSRSELYQKLLQVKGELEQ